MCVQVLIKQITYAVPQQCFCLLVGLFFLQLTTDVIKCKQDMMGRLQTGWKVHFNLIIKVWISVMEKKRISLSVLCCNSFYRVITLEIILHFWEPYHYMTLLWDTGRGKMVLEI